MNFGELMNTPRPFTALAEWCACISYILMLRTRLKGMWLAISFAAMLGLFFLLHMIAGILPLYLWFPGMIAAILLMYFSIYASSRISPYDAGFLCVRAFVLAEFTASFQWQLYVWWALSSGRVSKTLSVIIMLVTYGCIYTGYYFLENEYIPKDEGMEVERKELFSAVSIALGAFLISNISFVMPNTPFSSATSSLLYVRTLVDFGGLLMLFAQQNRRKELRVRGENHAMNIVLQRQYDQYRMAIDNMELLRREFHDLKHYMIAIRAEKDPKKREQYLSEMEKAILTQETLANTGNQVLDVVLTTKSTYCAQNKITFTPMVDGKLISFLHVKDICSIFGNALDNAIECVSQFEDPEKRLITLSIYKRNRFLMIQCENYSENPLAMVPNSIPPTTKGNKLYHGYGLKSIQAAAHKYGGSMTISSNDNWFRLQVLIPFQGEMPEAP
ncbi:ATP-binding protein [Lacrimispora sp.]|uniref:ATP-binding protein n=1 Tax=Lacrimispora sp. TaxID=2719234 RepID=UPI00289D4A2E|nr:ATP-binding protein [Lacrimispora sp.]